MSPKGTRKALLLITIFAFSSLLASCSKESKEFRAREKSVRDESKRDGFRDGKASGFSAAKRKSMNEAYNLGILEAKHNDEFRHDPYWRFGIVLFGFTLGFFLQYLASFFLRRRGLFSLNHYFMKAALILVCVGLQACKSEDEALKEQYDVNYSMNFSRGESEGAALGRIEGASIGKRQAKNDAKSGHSLRFYDVEFYVAVFLGILIGIAIQGAILTSARYLKDLPPPILLNFLPGVGECPAVLHQIAERDHENRLQELRRLHREDEESIGIALEREFYRIEAASTLQRLGSDRGAEIVDDALERRIENGKFFVLCPYCSRKLSVVKRSGNGRCLACSNRFQYGPFA